MHGWKEKYTIESTQSQIDKAEYVWNNSKTI
jgi:hypothetical protein